MGAFPMKTWLGGTFRLGGRASATDGSSGPSSSPFRRRAFGWKRHLRCRRWQGDCLGLGGQRDERLRRSGCMGLGLNGLHKMEFFLPGSNLVQRFRRDHRGDLLWSRLHRCCGTLYDIFLGWLLLGLLGWCTLGFLARLRSCFLGRLGRLCCAFWQSPTPNETNSPSSVLIVLFSGSAPSRSAASNRPCREPTLP